MEKALQSDGPVWIDCLISREERVLPMIPGGKDRRRYDYRLGRRTRSMYKPLKKEIVSVLVLNQANVLTR